MAATRIMPVHRSAAGAAQTVKAMIDYVKNPGKTSGGLFVAGHGCDPDIAAEDFMLSRDEYLFNTGRGQVEGEILVYHVRQSFVPGEIADADSANRLGHRLAMELTGGDHSFIVCTHDDRPHLHNHIVINAVNLGCDKKFRNEIASFRRVREISDRISAENDLHVIENPGFGKGARNRCKKTTKRDGLAALIDEILAAGPPKDFGGLLKQLEKSGCAIRRRGQTVSVRPPGAERFFRFKSGKNGLPEGYDEQSLKKKIAEMQAGAENELRDDCNSSAENMAAGVQSDAKRSDDYSSAGDDKELPLDAGAATIDELTGLLFIWVDHDRKIESLIDIENSIKAQNSPGYERWAKSFNLQQAAETLLFLQTNNLTDMADLTQAANQAKNDYDALQKRIDAADARMKEVNALQRHMGAYDKGREVYSRYLRSGRDPKIRLENEKALAAVEEAKAYFDSLGFEKLPTIKELQAEYSALSQEKDDCREARNGMRRHVVDLQSAKKNIEMLLGIDGGRDDERTKKKSLGEDR